MRFIHMADVHLGAVPDSGCPWSAFRENEIWETFVRVIDQIREEKIELLLIAGELFHRQPLPSQIERVSQLFASIPDTEVVWMAGSHDYLREDSAYRKAKWTKNVHGFLSGKPEVIELEKLHTKVYGCSYEQPQIMEPVYSTIRPDDQPGIHILLAYGGDETHIPMKKEDGAGFTYVALGYCHLPGVLVGGGNEQAITGAIGDIDPFEGFGTANFLPSVIYRVRLVIARWQNDRYESSRAKKQQLELRLLYLQMQKEEGQADPTVTREISDLQARIEKYDRYLREVEESIEERR